MKNKIKSMIEESAETNNSVAKFAPEIEKAVKLITDAIKANNKVILAGNGGSAAQASHIAAEFVGRFKIERKGLPGIALTTDPSILTSLSNDYGFESLFERQLEALANNGDVFISLSTSGNSKNLIKAVEYAKKNNIKTIGLLGKDGGLQKNTSEVEIIVTSKNTPRIQEAHIMILHIICELVDEKLFGGKV